MYFRDNNQVNDVKITTVGRQNIRLEGSSVYNDVSIDYQLVSSHTPTVTITSNNTFNDFTLGVSGTQRPTFTVNGSNTFNVLEIASGTNVFFGANQTQTTNDLILDGECARLIVIKSTATGNTATISQASDTVDAIFIWLQDITATGGAFFDATSAVDLGLSLIHI